MPRLLPADWIRIVAINRLLQLYEEEASFLQEWKDAKEPFIPLIEQFSKVSTIIEVEHLLTHSPPSDFIGWISDLQKLRNYLRDLYSGMEQAQNSSEMHASYDNLLEKLTPYISSLNELAYKWNLRAPWAGEELMWRDIQRIQQEIFDAAGITTLNKFSDRQIQKLLSDNSLRSAYIEPLYPGILSLYFSGGRVGYLNKLNDRLNEFEKELQASGAKEPPSALSKHAKWWFDHYVYNIKFPNIANKIAQIDKKGGPQVENIKKAVVKFSELLGINPIERP